VDIFKTKFIKLIYYLLTVSAQLFLFRMVHMRRCEVMNSMSIDTVHKRKPVVCTL